MKLTFSDLNFDEYFFPGFLPRNFGMFIYVCIFKLDPNFNIVFGRTNVFEGIKFIDRLAFYDKKFNSFI